MSTATQIITEALSLLGVRSAGESVQGNEAADALIRLNNIIDGWRLDKLYSYTTTTVYATLPSGSNALTIGPTGNIVVPFRPVSLAEGSYFTSGSIDYPMQVLTANDFNNISMKKLGALGPDAMYYSPDLPNGTIAFYPQGGGDVALTIQINTFLTEFATLNTDYTLPPGTRKALSYSLAEELSIDYGKPPNQMLMKYAQGARRALRRANHITPELAGCGSDYYRNIFGGTAGDISSGGNAGSP